MRKKIATLEVYVDSDSPVSGAFREFNPMTGRTRNNHWEIILNPNETIGSEKADLLSVFAHELGHFASQALETPAAMRDAVSSSLAQSAGTTWKHVPEAIVAHYYGEKEAWDVARRMGLPINEGTAEQALDSYREGVRQVEKAKAEGRI